jgi:anti-anti-sigma regulatory factor
VDGIPVVQLYGLLGSTAASPARLAMGVALAHRTPTIVVDLGECSHDSRTGRILLMVMRRHADRHGVRLRVAGASPTMVGELRRSGLHQLFDW